MAPRIITRKVRVTTISSYLMPLYTLKVRALLIYYGLHWLSLLKSPIERWFANFGLTPCFRSPHVEQHAYSFYRFHLPQVNIKL